MAELVDGDGWISDESSFYGDEETRVMMEEKAKRRLNLPHQIPKIQVPPVATETSSQSRPSGGSKVNAVDFLRSRPQIGEMQKVAAKGREPTRKESARTVGGEEAADFLDDDRFAGVGSAWQRDETADAFLRRAPVADPETAKLGPWLWVGNLKPIRSHQKHGAKADIESFVDGGEELLEAFSTHKAKLQSLSPDAVPATITRKMRPYREQLEDDLLYLAVKTATTCGKWMLFPSPDDYPRCWRKVVEATSAGKLGITSKAATLDVASQTGLICVYTYDFTKMDDVRRVLEELINLGVCRSDGKPIYYKCDAYTYLDIKSDNKYRIKASLYSSKEVLGQEAKALQDGPIARLQKRNQTIDSLFAT